MAQAADDRRGVMVLTRTAVRVDGRCLCDLAAAGDLPRLATLSREARAAVPLAWRYPLLLHPTSTVDGLLAARRREPLEGTAAQLAEALASGTGAGLANLCRAWDSLFRRHAARVGHRFDLHADYLASAREFVLTAIRAVPSALPPRSSEPGAAGQWLDIYSGTMRTGAMRYADRELYRLTRQMVREGVLTWRDERGRVVEHPSLRTQEDDPAPLVAEREFRREVRAFVVRFGPRLLGRRVWERFRLHFFEGWSQADIAAHHGVTQQAVSESLATAAVRLRQAMTEHRH